MLSDPDVALLKLALEWELIDARGYRTVVDTVRKSQGAGNVGRALRQIGVAGEKVGQLAEIAATAGGNSGVILCRCDLEDEIAARAIDRSKLLPPEKLEKARSEVKGLSRVGEVVSLSEVLVKRRWLEVPVAVELRRRARERVATCPKCHRHYIVEPDKAASGRYRCRECQISLEPGRGGPSAVDAARGLPATSENRPAPMPDASQVMRLGANEMAQLKAAQQQAWAKEAAAHGPPAVPGRPAPAPGTSTVRRMMQASPPSTQLTAQPPPPVGQPAPVAAPPKGKTPDPAPRPSAQSSGVRKAVEPPVPVPVSSDPFTPGKGARPDSETLADDSAPQAARWESVHDLDDDKPLLSDAAAAVATFGDYEILSEIARGGMGIVYKARRKGSPKLLALKVLISGVDATEEQVRRFEREGEAARRLRHPNIVRIYDAGRHEGYHYIAMEFVEGKSLEELITEGAFEGKRAATVMKDVARAVHSMHEAGVVHRDLKPGNILIGKDTAPKLIDFGLAKTIDRTAKLTRSGAAVGTPYYMPPEQVRGESEKIGPRSDVYALGAILYELVVGEVPFKAENPIELYHKIASSELVLPSALQKGLPPELETVIAVSMEKRVEDRYTTAAAMADDLDLFLADQPVRARRRGAVSRAARSARKHVLIGALAAFAVIVAAAALFVAIRVRADAKNAKAHAFLEQGLEQLRAGNAQGARVYLEDAQKLLPADVGVLLPLARAYAGCSDKEAALTTLERAVKAGLDDPALLNAQELEPIRAEPRFADCLKAVQNRGGS